MFDLSKFRARQLITKRGGGRRGGGGGEGQERRIAGFRYSEEIHETSTFSGTIWTALTVV